ncbi:MAG: hypothetical protein P1V51_19985 [Deltaproteobacteria bacterium]|nr:hypothetical protein [Deltaproteobacteria bacterium]
MAGNRLRIRLNSGLPMELVAKALAVVDSNHGQVHAKNAYSFPAFISALAAAGTHDIRIVVPASTYIHFQALAIAPDGEKWKLELYEGYTGTPTGGSAITPRNRNRAGGSNDNSALTVMSGEASITPTTLLDTIYVGGSSGGKASGGGQAVDDVEWVLNPGASYILRATNGGASASSANVKALWYEEASV